MYLTGEFPDAAATAQAIEALKARGFTAADLDVFSTEPVEFAPGVLDRPSRMSFFAAIGALTVGSLATGFIWFTQHHYPLVTGGMPLFSFWGTGVITYEMTMLGAIAATFVWLLQESGLLERGARGPAPVVEPGAIYLRVLCPDSRLAETGELLYRSGAARVEKLK
jgi:hypothetical protein